MDEAIRAQIRTEGKEILELGIDSSVSLHERLVTEEGKKFLEANIDELLKMSISDIKVRLQMTRAET